jgi:Peptidase family M23
MKFKKILALSLGLGLLASGVGLNQSQAAGVTPMSDPLNPYAGFYWYYPTNTSDITSPYGWRTINGELEFHKGFDLGAYLAPAKSVDAGKVLSAGTYSDDSRYVTIQTNDKDPDTSKLLVVRYIHLNSSSVSTGASVTRGQQIGVTGNTGGVGYHLHFDVNNAGVTSGGSMNESNTINPVHFWPSRSWSSPPADLTMNSLTGEEGHIEEQHGHSHDGYYNDEYFFEDTLINHVGEEKFKEWLLSLPMEERTVTNFKNHFNISDKHEKDIKAKPWKK